MQIYTIQKLQHALDTSKKIIKFVYRHALTLIVVGMIITALAIGKISWVNSFYFCIGAVFLDWFKTQFKSTGSNYNLAQEQMFESSKWSRPTQIGSAWDSYDPGSPAYYIRQDRYC